MEKASKIFDALAALDPVVVALLVALAAIGLGGMGLWTAVKLSQRGDDR